MADKGRTKLKLLYIKEYLEKFSDEDTPIDVEELTAYLKEKDIARYRAIIEALGLRK